MKNNRTPEIRFLGYTGDWDQRKLDSIVDRVKSYSLSRDVETSEYTGYKYIHYGDIHTKVADIIDEFSNLPNIKSGNYELLEKGDLVLTDASEDYQGIATPAVITIDMPYKLVSGLHTIALRPKQVDSLFLYYLINSSTFRKYGYRIGTGMKVFGISVTNLLKFEGMFPLLEEQTKIGNFLKQLDETIALHQQELTTLKQTKQGFLQKMFPKEGESVPEVRFSGFNGEWKKRKLGDVGRVAMCKRIFKEQTNINGEIPFFKIGTFGGTPDSFISREVFDEYRSKYTFPESGDILISASGTIGRTVVYNGEDAYYQDSNIVWLERDKEQLDNTFLQQFYQIVKWAGVEGSTIKRLYNNNILSTEILLPSIEEQTKIGKFFKQLDDTIALHQRELDALKETKKAFLQKMFV
ncbi:restriction endonuclease subunit S [Bacillus sp. 445_BSPC]|uniref:restriction endonuclease subunit S n=1 Tax=Bacillus sp. 445_BSPC TaxID=1581712 RepID=UPI00080B2DC6|nr:restriction endonuclease subunit S [Bacillus sp. 445_BSPC]